MKRLFNLPTLKVRRLAQEQLFLQPKAITKRAKYALEQKDKTTLKPKEKKIFGSKFFVLPNEPQEEK